MAASAYSNQPGYIHYICPDGRCVTIAAQGAISIGTSTLQVATDKPKEGDVAPIQDRINSIAILMDTLKNYDLGVEIGATLSPYDKISPSELAGYAEAAKASKDMTYELYSMVLEDLSAAEKESEEQTKRNECIEETVRTQGELGSSFFKQVLTSLLGEAIGVITDLLNSKLPSWAQVGINTGVDENGNITLEGISVGGITYDKENGTASVAGQVFSVFLRHGVDMINDQLPDYLQIDVSYTAIKFGSASLTYDEISTDPNNPTYINGAGVYVTSKGVVRMTVNDEEFDIAHLIIDYSTGVVTKLLSKGLYSINKSLPDFLQIDADVGFDPETGQFSGDISIGPLSIGTDEDGDLAFSLDVNSIIDTVGDFVGGVVENLIDQLPAPIAAIARAAWEALDFGGLLRGQLSNKKGTEDPRSVNESYSSCHGTTPATPPVVENKGSSPSTSEMITDVTDEAGDVA